MSIHLFSPILISIFTFLLLKPDTVLCEYLKVKRNDGAEIASTLDLAFAPLQRDEPIISSPSAPSAAASAASSKSEEELRKEEEENEQQKEVERMVILQNLNYLVSFGFFV